VDRSLHKAMLLETVMSTIMLKPYPPRNSILYQLPVYLLRPLYTHSRNSNVNKPPAYHNK